MALPLYHEKLILQMNSIIYQIAVYLVTKMNEIIVRLNDTFNKSQVQNIRDQILAEIATNESAISALGSNLANNYYTKSEVDSLVNGFLQTFSATTQTINSDLIINGSIIVNDNLDMAGNRVVNINRMNVNRIEPYAVVSNDIQITAGKLTTYDVDVVGHVVINPSGIANQGSLDVRGDFDHSVGEFNTIEDITTTGNVFGFAFVGDAVRVDEVQLGGGNKPRLITGTANPITDNPEAPRGSLYLNSSATNKDDVAWVSTQSGEDTLWHRLDAI